MVVTRERIEAGRIHKFTVTRSDVGWQVREECDSETVRVARYTDWHRVERAMDAFERPDPSDVPFRH
jgi:hypothetical protein